jgi:hypothetical protein
MSDIEDPQFSFQTEINPFLKDKFISSFDFLEGGEEGSNFAKVVFTTLESIRIEAEWST